MGRESCTDVRGFAVAEGERDSFAGGVTRAGAGVMDRTSVWGRERQVARCVCGRTSALTTRSAALPYYGAMSLFWMRSVLCAALIAAPLAAQSTTVLENPLIRVIDALDVPHRKTALHKHDLNRVMIYITSGDLDVTSEDGKVDHQLRSAKIS